MSALPSTLAVPRPVLRYHGGKFSLAPWIASHFPTHRTYTEAYCGGASVLLRKPRSYAEVINDIDSEIVNLFRVLRNPAQAREMVRLVTLTPYAREEFEASYITADDPIEQARRTLFRSAAGHSTVGASGRWRTGFRCNVRRTGTHPAQDWANLPQALDAVVARLRGVVVENMSALDMLRKYDGPATLHYVDPPYLVETRHERWAGYAYRYEMGVADHQALAETLQDLKGTVVLSGYPHPLYDQWFADWARYTHQAHSDRASDRVEVLWVKSTATVQPSLLEVP